MKAFFKPIYLLALLFFVTEGCQREFNWYISATGTLKDAQGECMPAKVRGTFYNGVTPGKDTAYIEVKVNVFTTGAYSIFTDMQNGLRFTDSGSFNSTGLHTVKLKPNGTPLAHSISNFTICFDTSCCPLSLDIKDSAKNELVPVNSWRYTDVKKGITYRGPINATYFLITPLAALLSLRKEITRPTDTSFEIGIGFLTKNITTGSFKTDTLNEVAFSTHRICINCAWEVMYKFYGVLTTIVVTSYNPETKVIKGTFSGTTIDEENNIAPIKDGVFSAIVK